MPSLFRRRLTKMLPYEQARAEGGGEKQTVRSSRSPLAGTWVGRSVAGLALYVKRIAPEMIGALITVMLLQSEAIHYARCESFQILLQFGHAIATLALALMQSRRLLPC